MFKIKVKSLRDPVFHQAMRLIYSSDKLPSTKAAFHAKKLVVELDKNTDTANDLYRTLVEKYCEIDDNGNHVLNNKDDPTSRVIRKDDLEEFQKKSAEMHETDIEIDVRKLDVTMLSNVQLAPAHLTVIEPVIDWKNFDD